MTESEWLGCADPESMIAFLGDRLGVRKLRQFGLACCQRVLHLLDPNYIQSSRGVLDVWDRFLDGRASEQEWNAAADVATANARDAGGAIGHPAEVDYYAVSFAAEAISYLDHPGVPAAVQVAAEALAYAALAAQPDAAVEAIAALWKSRERSGPGDWEADERAIRQLPTYLAALAAERRHQADLLRDLVGNPYHQVLINRSWLEANQQAARQATRRIERGGLFSELPILADMLEEAGCQDEAILTHCRLPGQHVKGCWVLEALLRDQPNA
jgi:hypothetical protein